MKTWAGGDGSNDSTDKGDEFQNYIIIEVEDEDGINMA